MCVLRVLSVWGGGGGGGHINNLQSAYQDTTSFCVPEMGLKLLPSIECIPEVVK